MLEIEKIPAQKFAYDRPSPLLLSFLRKHYNLTRFHPQNNNFVIYDDYFESDKRTDLRAPSGASSAKFEPSANSQKSQMSTTSLRPQTFHLSQRQVFFYSEMYTIF